MKKINVLGLFILFLLFLSSCCNDDDFLGEDINSNDLIGTWLLESESFNGEDVADVELECPVFLEFTDFEVIETEYYGDDCSSTQVESFTYFLDGNVIESAVGDAEILLLNEEVLQLRILDVYYEDNIEYIDTYVSTYNKQ